MSKCWASPQRQWETSYAQREWDGLAGKNLHPTRRWDKAPQRIGTWVRFWKQAAITKMKNGKKDFVGRMKVNANPITALWSWSISVYILYFLRCLSWAALYMHMCISTWIPHRGQWHCEWVTLSPTRFSPLCSLQYWINHHSSLFYLLGVC